MKELCAWHFKCFAAIKKQWRRIFRRWFWFLRAKCFHGKVKGKQRILSIYCTFAGCCSDNSVLQCNIISYRRGLLRKLFHEYRFSSRVMKIDMSGIISLITQVIRYDIIPLSQVCLCSSGSGGENGWNWLSLILCPDHILDRTAKSSISKILVFHRAKMLIYHLGP